MGEETRHFQSIEKDVEADEIVGRLDKLSDPIRISGSDWDDRDYDKINWGPIIETLIKQYSVQELKEGSEKLDELTLSIPIKEATIKLQESEVFDAETSESKARLLLEFLDKKDRIEIRGEKVVLVTYDDKYQLDESTSTINLAACCSAWQDRLQETICQTEEIFETQNISESQELHKTIEDLEIDSDLHLAAGIKKEMWVQNREVLDREELEEQFAKYKESTVKESQPIALRKTISISTDEESTTGSEEAAEILKQAKRDIDLLRRYGSELAEAESYLRLQYSAQINPEVPEEYGEELNEAALNQVKQMDKKELEEKYEKWKQMDKKELEEKFEKY